MVAIYLQILLHVKFGVKFGVVLVIAGNQFRQTVLDSYCRVLICTLWQIKMTAVGFEPKPLRNGALSHHLRPLGQTVLIAGVR